MVRPSTLILTAKDITPFLNMRLAIKAVESVFKEYSLRQAIMPSKIYLDLPDFSGDFRAMPSYSKKIGKAALKWVNAHSSNAKAGLPSVMALLILNDPKTGFPLCVMDATLLTSLRTGAAAGVAAKYLARQESSVIGLVGCGVQARSQLQALRELYEIKLVKVWGQEIKLARQFVDVMKQKNEDMKIVDHIEACVRDCDIVVTTTPSRRPLVRRDWINPGTHINAIGADAKGKQELEVSLLKSARIIVDDIGQASHSGEINVGMAQGKLTLSDIYAPLGDIVVGRKIGRRSKEQITIFDSTGLAIQDLAVADLIYRAAKKAHVGNAFDII